MKQKSSLPDPVLTTCVAAISQLLSSRSHRIFRITIALHFLKLPEESFRVRREGDDIKDGRSAWKQFQMSEVCRTPWGSSLYHRIGFSLCIRSRSWMALQEMHSFQGWTMKHYSWVNTLGSSYRRWSTSWKPEEGWMGNVTASGPGSTSFLVFKRQLFWSRESVFTKNLVRFRAQVTMLGSRSKAKLKLGEDINSTKTAVWPQVQWGLRGRQDCFIS